MIAIEAKAEAQGWVRELRVRLRMETGDVGDWLGVCGSKCETKRNYFRVKRKGGLAGSGRTSSTASNQSFTEYGYGAGLR